VRKCEGVVTMPTVIMAEFSDVRYDARVLKQAKAISGMGFKVQLHMYNTGTDKNYTKVEGNIVYNIYGFSKRNSNKGFISIFNKYFYAFKLLISINSWILSHKADYYHAHNLKFILTSFIASYIYGGKFVYDAHELHSEHYNNNFSGKIKNYINKCIERVVLTRCHAFIQASDERANYISAKYKIDKPYVINNYVPLKQVSNSNNRLREELGLDARPIIFYSGGIYLGGGRRLENVIEAVRGIENCYLVIIGFMNDSVRNGLIKLLDSEPLNSRVYILPPKLNCELFDYASSADIGIIPLAGNSINTQYSALNKVSEYLMAGLPILCSNYQNLRNIVYNNSIGQVGETFDVLSIDSIRDAINNIISDENYKRMKNNALDLAIKEFNWEKEETKIKQIYASTHPTT